MNGACSSDAIVNIDRNVQTINHLLRKRFPAPAFLLRIVLVAEYDHIGLIDCKALCNQLVGKDCMIHVQACQSYFMGCQFYSIGTMSYVIEKLFLFVGGKQLELVND